MAENTLISWATHTANFWTGCIKVSDPGLCTNCYAETLINRFGGNFERDRPMVKKVWSDIPRWQKQSEKTGDRPRVFVMSLGDFFEALPENHKDYYDLYEARRRAIDLMEQTTGIDYLVLTKRISNVRKMVPRHWLEIWPSHIRLGISVGTQKDADRDIPRLLKIDAPNFLSMEPLLERVDISWALESHELGELPQDENGHASSVYSNAIDWVITGGESGPHARPMHPDWARSLRDQCQAAGVAFHFKQWGRNLPESQWDSFSADINAQRCARNSYDLSERTIRSVRAHGERFYPMNKSETGHLLDGEVWQQFPEALTPSLFAATAATGSEGGA